MGKPEFWLDEPHDLSTVCAVVDQKEVPAAGRCGNRPIGFWASTKDARPAPEDFRCERHAPGNVRLR